MELPSDERSAARFARIDRALGELAKGQAELAAALERLAAAAASRASLPADVIEADQLRTEALERAEPWRRVMRERLEFEIRRLDDVLAELRRGREGGGWYRP